MEFVAGILKLQKWFDVDVSDFQILRFDVDIVVFIGLETVFGYFFEKKFTSFGHLGAGWPECGRKFAQIWEKVAKQLPNQKCQNIFFKDKFESTNHLHQTPSKLLKYLKTNYIPPEIFQGL